MYFAFKSFISVVRAICLVPGDKKLNKALVSGLSTREKERLFIVTKSSRRTRYRLLCDYLEAVF